MTADAEYQAAYIVSLETALAQAHARIRHLESAWARGAPCPWIVTADEGTSYCALAARPR